MIKANKNLLRLCRILVFRILEKGSTLASMVVTIIISDMAEINWPATKMNP